jgi:MFS family permease
VRPALKSFLAIAWAFLLIGVAFALWFVHIPVVVARLGLEPWLLGLALLSGSLGGLLMMAPSAVIVMRLGPSRAVAWTLAPFAVLAQAPIHVPSVPLLFLALAAGGMVMGVLNTASNTRASDWEVETGRPMMSVFHAFYSGGALVGAVLGAWMLGLPGGSGVALLVALGVMVAVSVAVIPWFGPSVPHPRAAGAPGARAALASPFLIALAGIALFSDSVEGAVNEWSALYLHTVRDLTKAQAAWGFAVFSAVMTTVRIFGALVVARFGERRVLLAGGVLIAVGFGVILLAPSPHVAIAGFGVVALGSANLVPVLTSLGGRAEGVPPAAGIALVAAACTAGMLMGPPVIGFVAQGFGLSVALAVVGCFGLVVAGGVAALRWPAARRV